MFSVGPKCCPCFNVDVTFQPDWSKAALTQHSVYLHIVDPPARERRARRRLNTGLFQWNNLFLSRAGGMF